MNMRSYLRDSRSNDKKQRENIIRIHISVNGIVQGVGFRPFIYNLAKKYSLSGYVLNDTRGVDIEVEGKRISARRFLREIKRNYPPLAVIDSITWRKLPPIGYANFEIRSSRREKDRFLPISPDVSICEDCLRELQDPEDRRYGCLLYTSPSPRD